MRKQRIAKPDNKLAEIQKLMGRYPHKWDSNFRIHDTNDLLTTMNGSLVQNPKSIGQNIPAILCQISM